MWRASEYLNIGSKPVIKGERGAGTMSEIAVEKDITELSFGVADVERAWARTEYAQKYSLMDVQVMQGRIGKGVHVVLEKDGGYVAVPVSVNAEHEALTFDMDQLFAVKLPTMVPGDAPNTGQPVGDLVHGPAFNPTHTGTTFSPTRP
jgi:hypothetical protein